VSDVKAWNGSAWVRPSFHMGGDVWRSYEPPEYTTPVGQFTFDGSAEGWFNCTYGGGFVYDDTPGGWFANVAQCNSPDMTPPWDLQPDIDIRARYLWSSEMLAPGWYGANRSIRFNFMGNETQIALPLPDNAPQWYTHPKTWPTNDINYGLELWTGVALWGTNDDQVRLKLHECRIENAATGQPLYRLSAPGWQPFVFNGQKWV